MIVRLTIEFDGTAYCGWQTQSNGLAVQQVLEEALAQVQGVPVRVTASGRTDAGVHARGMVVHFHTENVLPLGAYREGVNVHLPDDIAVQSVALAPADFNALRCATGKWYRYTILQHPVRSPLASRTAWHIRAPLDLAAMQGGADHFVGFHDFARFRTTDCDAKTTRREVFAVEVVQRGELITIDVRGAGFLRHMVRIMAGTLVAIGLGKRPADDVRRLLAGEPGLAAGPNAPPQGLCLMEVYY